MIVLTHALLAAIRLETDQVRRIATLKDCEEKIDQVFHAFPVDVNGVIECSLTYTTVNLNVAGTRADLLLAMRKLYALGFCTDDKPKAASEKQSEFSAYFTLRAHKDRDWLCTSHVWLNFSSTQCKRIEVGRQTIELPVYETVCE